MKSRLLTPGPTPIPERVLRKMAEPIIHHRTEEFEEVMAGVQEGLQWLLGTNQEVLILASSGTGAMEAAVTNLLSPGDRAAVVCGGKFGERWGDLLRTYGIEAVEISVAWGKSVDPARVREVLEGDPGIRALYLQASETSTGAKHPVREVAEITRQREHTVLVVDGITAVGVFPMPMDEWGIDVVVTGSQKALMLPPGLAFCALSPKAWKRVSQSALPRYYFDLARERDNQVKRQTAYTPAISLIIGLREVLAMMREEGLEFVFERNARMARATQEAMKALGLTLYSGDSPSEALTAVCAPEGIDAQQIVKLVWQQSQVKLTGGQDQAKGKIFRIAHMGYIRDPDLLAGIEAIEVALHELGHPVEQGTGLARAKEILNR